MVGTLQPRTHTKGSEGRGGLILDPQLEGPTGLGLAPALLHPSPLQPEDTGSCWRPGQCEEQDAGRGHRGKPISPALAHTKALTECCWPWQSSKRSRNPEHFHRIKASQPSLPWDAVTVVITDQTGHVFSGTQCSALPPSAANRRQIIPESKNHLSGGSAAP